MFLALACAVPGCLANDIDDANTLLVVTLVLVLLFAIGAIALIVMVCMYANNRTRGYQQVESDVDAHTHSAVYVHTHSGELPYDHYAHNHNSWWSTEYYWAYGIAACFCCLIVLILVGVGIYYLVHPPGP